MHENLWFGRVCDHVRSGARKSGTHIFPLNWVEMNEQNSQTHQETALFYNMHKRHDFAHNFRRK